LAGAAQDLDRRWLDGDVVRPTGRRYSPTSPAPADAERLRNAAEGSIVAHLLDIIDHSGDILQRVCAAAA
jgi:hypothetical protein